MKDKGESFFWGCFLIALAAIAGLAGVWLAWLVDGLIKSL